MADATAGRFRPAAPATVNILVMGAAALPAAIGVGIVKYRLYDIDRIISRTLSYAAFEPAHLSIWIKEP